MRKMLLRSYLACLIINAEGFAQTTIISDGTWKGVGSYSAAGPGWNNAGYNDASWPLVEAPNVANVIPVVPGSLSIWTLPYSDTAYMRKTFYVPVGDSYTGSISINADNEFILYFNGTQLGAFNNWMGGPYTFNISPSLQGCVENVVGVHGINWGGPNGMSLNTTINVVNPLETPVALPPTNVLCTSFTANWNAVPTATDYLLDVSDDPNFATFFSVYQNFSTGGATSAAISGLTAGVTYYYRVRAFRAPLTSCYSNAETFDPLFSISASSNSPVCEGESITLSGSQNGSNPVLAWTGPNGFSSTSEDPVIASATSSMSGQYIFTMTNPGCDPISDTISVIVYPVSDLDTTLHFCEGTTININGNTYSSDTTFSLLFTSASGCDSTVTFELLREPVFADTINYELCSGESVLLPDGSTSSDSGMVVFNYLTSFGCDSILVVSIVKLQEELCVFIIPNVISPNGDGYNDQFVIKGLRGSGNKIRFFNRWGSLVFQSDDYTNTWKGVNEKGEELPTGVYYYLFSDNEGKNYNGFVHITD